MKSNTHELRRHSSRSARRPKAKVPATYIVKPAQAVAVQTSLQTLFPTAAVASDSQPLGQIIVVASADQQEKIAQVIELLASGSNAAERTVRVFRSESGSRGLDEHDERLAGGLALRRFGFEPNTANNTILAIGSASDWNKSPRRSELQQQIPEPDVSATRVYSLRHGSTVGAVTVLQTMLPKATIVQDLATRNNIGNRENRRA
jgi:hypothetical protein